MCRPPGRPTFDASPTLSKEERNERSGSTAETDRKWPAAVGAAVLAAGLTAAVFVFAVGTGSEKNASSIPAKPPLTASPALARSGQGSDPIMSLTFAQLAAGAAGHP
jgi:hypothetical protein